MLSNAQYATANDSTILDVLQKPHSDWTTHGYLLNKGAVYNIRSVTTQTP